MDRAADELWRVASLLADEAAAVSRSTTRRALPPLLFFTDGERTPRPWETAVRLPPGSAVVFRGFGAADAGAKARRLRDVTAPRNVRLLIAQDADLAQSVGADGVHLPERLAHLAGDLAAAQPAWLITGAAHSREALMGVRFLDAAVLSPVFAAGGASAAKPPLGLARFSDWVGDAPCPIYALGGITSRNAADLIGSGACGIAAVDAIQAAFGPKD